MKKDEEDYERFLRRALFSGDDGRIRNALNTKNRDALIKVAKDLIESGRFIRESRDRAWERVNVAEAETKRVTALHKGLMAEADRRLDEAMSEIARLGQIIANRGTL